MKYNFDQFKSLFDTLFLLSSWSEHSNYWGRLCGRRDFKDESDVGRIHFLHSHGVRGFFATFFIRQIVISRQTHMNAAQSPRKDEMHRGISLQIDDHF